MISSKMSSKSISNFILVLSLVCALIFFRVFILFSLLPMQTQIARYYNRESATILLYGYSGMQAVMQLFWGYISDIYGRLKVLRCCIIIFALGSFIGFYADDFHTLAIARVVQGAAAYGSVSLALLFDLVPKNLHVISMAIVGMTFAMAFLSSMIIPSLIEISLTSVFSITLIFTILSFLITIVLPTTNQKKYFSDLENSKNIFLQIKNNVDISISLMIMFGLHAHLSLVFYYLSQLDTNYTLPIFFSFILAFVLIGFWHNKKSDVLYIIMYSLLSLSILLLLYFPKFSIFLFLIAFNCLEAIIPTSLAQQFKGSRGLILGISATLQYLGMTLINILLSFMQIDFAIIFFSMILSIFWVLIIGFKKSFFKEFEISNN